MVKLISKDLDWKLLELQIRQALLLPDSPETSSVILHLTDTGHSLEKLEAHDTLSIQAPYQEPHFIQRLIRSSPTQEALLKAIGCKGHYKPSVIDATAGFGVDAFLMAFNHCKVSCIEWNPLVSFLVADSLSHSQNAFLMTALQYLQYYAQDARVLIPELPPHEVIYLDPMFPEKRKQAKVKKYMQMMQTITALYSWCHIDETELFHLAASHATKRVVVKRPKSEEPIYPNPNYAIIAQSIRFDVYML